MWNALKGLAFLLLVGIVGYYVYGVSPAPLPACIELRNGSLQYSIAYNARVGVPDTSKPIDLEKLLNDPSVEEVQIFEYSEPCVILYSQWIKGMGFVKNREKL